MGRLQGLLNYHYLLATKASKEKSYSKVKVKVAAGVWEMRYSGCLVAWLLGCACLWLDGFVGLFPFTIATCPSQVVHSHSFKALTLCLPSSTDSCAVFSIHRRPAVATLDAIASIVVASKLAEQPYILTPAHPTMSP